MAATTIVTGTTERGEPDTPIVEPPVFIWLAPDLATIQTFQWDWVFRKKNQIAGVRLSHEASSSTA